MTAASPRRLVVAALVIAVHGVLLALLLRSVAAVAPPPVPVIEVVNIAAPPPSALPPPPPVTAVSARSAPAAAPAQVAPAAPPAAPPVTTAAPTAPARDGITGTARAPGGSGTADGGGIVRAVHAGGSITRRDYPAAANAAGVQGSVTVVFDVRPDGGVEKCRVVVSSGAALLDATTCTLIEARFRYTPARDAQGTAIADVAGWKQDWWLAR